MDYELSEYSKITVEGKNPPNIDLSGKDFYNCTFRGYTITCSGQYRL